MSPEAQNVIRAAVACRSVAVTGLAKNAGKTESLNFLIEGLVRLKSIVGVTSIGTDGETVDRVTATPKPEITLHSGMLFATTEIDYSNRRITSEVLEVGTRQTPLGRIVIARGLGTGKAIISGPSDIPSMKTAIGRMQRLGADTVLVDGALFRQSLASPTVTSGMILATGAAVSRTVSGVVEATSRVIRLLTLPESSEIVRSLLNDIPSGINAVEDGKLIDLGITSGLSLQANASRVFSHGSELILSGAVTDRIIEWFAARKECKGMILNIPDFTKVFASAMSLRRYLAAGGELRVGYTPRLLAVTLNPLSPEGFRLDSCELQDRLRGMLDKFGLENVPAIDVISERHQ